MDYVTVKTYFSDMAIVDERLKRLEHLIDVITRNEVEALSNKGINKRKKNGKHTSTDEWII